MYMNATNLTILEKSEDSAFSFCEKAISPSVSMLANCRCRIKVAYAVLA